MWRKGRRCTLNCPMYPTAFFAAAGNWQKMQKNLPANLHLIKTPYYTLRAKNILLLTSFISAEGKSERGWCKFGYFCNATLWPALSQAEVFLQSTTHSKGQRYTLVRACQTVYISKPKMCILCGPPLTDVVSNKLLNILYFYPEIVLKSVKPYQRRSISYWTSWQKKRKQKIPKTTSLNMNLAPFRVHEESNP